MSELRVVIPYLPRFLYQETRDWGESVGAEFRDVSSDEKAYRRLLGRLWHEGRAFVVVEQDIVPPVAALTGFDECSEPWCCHSYPYVGATWAYGQLGCTRFSAALLADLPNLVEESEQENPWAPFKLGSFFPDWARLAPTVRSRLERYYGVRWHVHRPSARHFTGHRNTSAWGSLDR